jgi:hypothetical protein
MIAGQLVAIGALIVGMVIFLLSLRYGIPFLIGVLLLGQLGKVAAARVVEAADINVDRVSRWIDLRGDADPVPDGPIATSAQSPPNYQDVRITVNGSTITDHTSYWRCADSFVWQVVAALQKLSATTLQAAQNLERCGKPAARQRTWRVRARTAVRWGLAASTLMLLAARTEWYQHPAVLRVLDLAQSLPWIPLLSRWRWWQSWAAAALFAVSVLGMVYLAYQVVLLPWRLWDFVATKRFISLCRDGAELKWAGVPLTSVTACLFGLFGVCALTAIELEAEIATNSIIDVIAGLYASLALASIFLFLYLWLLAVFGVVTWVKRGIRRRRNDAVEIPPIESTGLPTRIGLWASFAVAAAVPVAMPLLIRGAVDETAGDQISSQISDDRFLIALLWVAAAELILVAMMGLTYRRRKRQSRH